MCCHFSVRLSSAGSHSRWHPISTLENEHPKQCFSVILDFRRPSIHPSENKGISIPFLNLLDTFIGIHSLLLFSIDTSPSTSTHNFESREHVPISRWLPKRSSTLTSSIWRAMEIIWALECGSMKISLSVLLILTSPKRVPGDNSRNKDSLEYYLWLAKLAEKGNITGIFFADTYGVHDTWPGQTANQFLSGATCAQMDPIVWVSAMASVTKSVSFGITASTSYINVSH